ncbi:hypothetical protein NDU88_009330 [Pleurodeles waltl]|uniref:Uncharacterized protein n=1 Tax=Pleurodeles waltl TaxID=8319 RepID=A0AAV7PUL3_PLEWA|nr:hypothetical protein NDU88_009330 [Pleurodeles waltl]
MWISRVPGHLTQFYQLENVEGCATPKSHNKTGDEAGETALAPSLLTWCWCHGNQRDAAELDEQLCRLSEGKYPGGTSWLAESEQEEAGLFQNAQCREDAERVKDSVKERKERRNGVPVEIEGGETEQPGDGEPLQHRGELRPGEGEPLEHRGELRPGDSEQLQHGGEL